PQHPEPLGTKQALGGQHGRGASTVIAFRLTPVLHESGLSRGARGGFDAGGRHATEGAGRPLDIAGQSDKLMDLFSIGFAVRCLEECWGWCGPTWRSSSARQTQARPREGA